MNKILFSVGTFRPATYGGAAQFAYWVAKHLPYKDYEVYVATTTTGLPKSNKVKVNKWYKSDSLNLLYQKSLFHKFPFLLLIKTFYKTNKVHIVHINGLFYPLSFLLAFYSVLKKKKVVWSIHGELDPLALKYSKLKKKIIIRLINKFAARHVTFHTTCKEETEYLKSTLTCSIKHIELPVFMDIPKQLFCEKDKYILYVGRIHPKKALENLINGFYHSSEFNRSDYRLKIVGNNNNHYGSELKQLVKDLDLQESVQFLGHKDGIEKDTIIAKAKMLLMPSHTENFGIVAVEALAQGTPVFASKGTPWKVLKDEECGFWDKNSPHIIATYIDKIINMDTQKYDQLCSKARLVAKKQFDINENIDMWVRAYENI